MTLLIVLKFNYIGILYSLHLLFACIIFVRSVQPLKLNIIVQTKRILYIENEMCFKG